MFSKKVFRKKLLLFFANHQPCLVGMEACLLFLVSTPRAGRTDCWDISKRGNTYLRTMLIHGGRSVLRHRPKKEDGVRSGCGSWRKDEVMPGRRWRRPIKWLGRHG
ncbi:MAG: hypothetical protein BA863_05985 [Desulfovibrio sp. S3730MH75]|nr:MAG: hypothetical protein BA863_05985 [Desulfovibrio sp. S3730MH75]